MIKTMCILLVVFMIVTTILAYMIWFTNNEQYRYIGRIILFLSSLTLLSINTYFFVKRKRCE